MVCPQCDGIEREFNSDVARRQLRDFRRRGPDRTTRILIQEIERRGVDHRTVLDIGGGIGAIQMALLEAGAERAASVDASSAYDSAAEEEARRRGWADRITRVHGDFVGVAEAVEAADIVTLDRVICCYPDVEALVDLSAAHAQWLYGLVYPRRTWWLRPAFRLANVILRLRGSSFRAFLHPPEVVEAVVERNGLRRVFLQFVGIWQVAVYARGRPAAGGA